MIAYQFISDEHVLKVLSDQWLKLSLINDLNDPYELIAADLSDFESRREAIKFKNHMNENFGFLCFSKNWKNPLLWSHYANRHKGAALKVVIDDKVALPVRYRKNRFPINFKEKIINKIQVTREELEGIWLTKFDSWSYEEEIRVICNKSDCIPKENKYFYPLNHEIRIVGIVLGSLCKISINDIKQNLPKGNSLEIIKSRLAFRSFNIVEQKSFKKLIIKN